MYICGVTRDGSRPKCVKNIYICIRQKRGLKEKRNEGIYESFFQELVTDQATTTQQRMFKMKTNSHSTEEKKDNIDK